MATTATTTANPTIKFNKIKGAPGALRVENINLEILEKAVAMTGKRLCAYDENGKPEFLICFADTDDSTVSVNGCIINPEHVEDNLIVLSVEGENPEAVIVRAAKYITDIYNEAITTAQAYDAANAAIKEV